MSHEVFDQTVYLGQDSFINENCSNVVNATIFGMIIKRKTDVDKWHHLPRTSFELQQHISLIELKFI